MDIGPRRASPKKHREPFTATAPLGRLDGERPVALGVAAWLAQSVGASPLIVRVAFVVLGIAGGAGVALYGAAWWFLARRDPPRPRPLSLRHDVGVVVAFAAVLTVMVGVLPSLPAALLWSAAFVAFALAFSARSAVAPELRTGLALGRTVVGLLLMLAGVVTGLQVIGASSQLWIVSVSAFALILGIGLVLAPWLRAIVDNADADRRERIRAEERADLAAHLHDSVLQTLTLIQNRASEPQVTAALAHQQERELRQWLYATDPTSAPPDRSLRAGLNEVAAEVEDQYLIVVDCIVVGDAPITTATAALVAATREALVNAAKFSESQLISLYAEVKDGRALAFVRDRGTGFDPDAVGADRRGIADSIYARVERAGGEAVVRSNPGSGTEVRIEVPA